MVLYWYYPDIGIISLYHLIIQLLLYLTVDPFCGWEHSSLVEYSFLYVMHVCAEGRWFNPTLDI